jgi:5-methylcytosine-specific restriction enzyme A
VTVNRYERDLEARQKSIDHHGARCLVCEFDFAKAYGAIGEGFIHVHHTVPLSQIRASYVVDPINHLKPVCPNCHAMLHKRKHPEPYSIDELRSILREVRNRS